MGNKDKEGQGELVHCRGVQVVAHASFHSNRYQKWGTSTQNILILDLKPQHSSNPYNILLATI